MDKVLRDKRAIIILVLPALILFIGIVFVPIVWSSVYSFYSGMPGAEFKFIGIENYLNLFSNQQFVDALLMNLRYVGIVFIGQVGFGLMIASILYFSVTRFRTLSRTIIFLPVILPVVAVGQLFTKIFEITPQNGLVNALLHALNLNSLITPWLGQSLTAFIVLCIMDIWTGMGFHSMILYGGLINIPSEIIEAAKIDGAAMIRLYWHIVLPYLRPVIITCTVFSLSGTLKLFESALALTGGGPGSATTSLSMVMYNEAFTFGHYGFGSAVAIFILLECLGITSIVRFINSRFGN
jgi:raffinose/stachyose/melibiose transport system permease protein